ncbi:DUF368 domain-containing protein [Marixanthomonas spongiae]|uniref:DUF368 domain-containing protein n=1 Tax=Marixanthomonas spongiae TaxID=2174845 RepID=A0A2U0I0H0_9FLAO|nr:DUF368 domain-containing protein [Marixanthomonas spongiae]PVW14603.1 DUF368 domain-containing protein [Marixanthomonas spongiae]
MPKRNFIQYLVITAKGMAMGAADVVPGVSGGTIAFISGIYEELIETIHKLDLGFLKLWKKEGISTAWKTYNLSFLVALFAGVAISILSLAKVITWLLSNHPILVWSFFFGLVIASILYVGKQVTSWSVWIGAALIIAAAAAYGVTLAEPLGTADSTWFLFFAGFIAIIAMILPGISGAFILLLMGAYTGIIGTISLLGEGIANMDWQRISQALMKIGIFAIGAIAGLKVFSRVLNWMFKNHKNLILAVLTGFMVGALNKIWPWKEVLKYRVDSHGEEVPFIERSIMPTQYPEDPQILLALLFMVLGFLSIFILERAAVSKKKA